jgi:hypothetical protein
MRFLLYNLFPKLMPQKFILKHWGGDITYTYDPYFDLFEGTNGVQLGKNYVLKNKKFKPL